MRILLTNDDGIHADGLKSLEKIARALSDDVWIVAPEHEQSGKSRALTLAEPLRVRRYEPRRMSVTGTPTDCVMMGIRNLLEDGRPDLVLSGVNRGQNVGEDVTMSGTVAGAMEGMALGVRSIALSQSVRRVDGELLITWDVAETFGPGIVRRLLEIGWPAGVVLNVNFPCASPDAVTQVEVTRQGFRDTHIRMAEKRTDPHGREYYWTGYEGKASESPEGTDLRAIREGRISVTPLHIDLTHLETVHALKGVLGGQPPKA
jgi:5'-nucleotidase